MTSFRPTENRFWSLFTLLLSLLISGGPAHAEATPGGSNFAIGKCIVQINNSNVYQSVTACQDTPAPAKAIAVSYFWLDSRMASFLIADKFDPNLNRLLGNRPVILKNEV